MQTLAEQIAAALVERTRRLAAEQEQIERDRQERMNEARVAFWERVTKVFGDELMEALRAEGAQTRADSPSVVWLEWSYASQFFVMRPYSHADWRIYRKECGLNAWRLIREINPYGVDTRELFLLALHEGTGGRLPEPEPVETSAF